MIGIEAVLRITGDAVLPPVDAGRIPPNPQAGSVTIVQQLGVVAFDDNRPQEFDATGNWVWDDGIWLEWDDGEVIQQ